MAERPVKTQARVVISSTESRGKVVFTDRPDMRRPGGGPARTCGKADKRSHREWADDDMEGALHELATQFAVNTKACKTRKECKSMRQIVKEWNVPRATLQRYSGPRYRRPPVPGRVAHFCRIVIFF